MPRFQLGKLFKTGWTRKKDRKPGDDGKPKDMHAHEEVVIQTIQITRTYLSEIAKETGVGNVAEVKGEEKDKREETKEATEKKVEKVTEKKDEKEVEKEDSTLEQKKAPKGMVEKVLVS